MVQVDEHTWAILVIFVLFLSFSQCLHVTCEQNVFKAVGHQVKAVRCCCWTIAYNYRASLKSLWNVFLKHLLTKPSWPTVWRLPETSWKIKQRTLSSSLIRREDGHLMDASSPSLYCSLQVEQDVLPEVLRLENMHSPDNVLSAYRAFVHALPAFSAGDHVTALQQDTVNYSVHADATQVVISG